MIVNPQIHAVGVVRPEIAMLTQAEYETYCKQANLSDSAIKYIEGVRNNPPSRRVGDDAKGNVCSRIPALSLSQIVQSESRTCEAIFIFKTELFDDVFEVWDQPTQLQLRRDKGPKGVHVSNYTPDFLVLRRDGPVLMECKTHKAIAKLMRERPEDWAHVDGLPRFVPAYEAAKLIGIKHEIFIADDTAPIYLANLEFLYALKLEGGKADSDTQLTRVKAKLADNALTIFQLCGMVRDLEPPKVYRWLANGDLHGAFRAQLLSQEDAFRVFANSSDAIEFEKEVVNARRLQPDKSESDLAAILQATPKELAHAKRLHSNFEEVVNGKRKPTRNEYRYLGKFNEISEVNGHTLAAFLPRFSDRGNDRSRLTEGQDETAAEVIKANVENGTFKTVAGLTGKINAALEKKGEPKISQESARLRFVNQSKSEAVAEGRLGRRGYHNALRPVDAKHATLRSEIAGLLAHVDSTQFDDRVWAQGPLSEFMQCPWIFAYYDEATTRAQGCWIGFGKSDRFALSLATRDTAVRQGSLPPYIFSDRGPEYGSIWWEMLLAEKNIAKYSRPAGAPRFGGIQESSLKQINTQLAHCMAGNTWADQKGRSASGSKKSRATARLAFELVVHEVQRFLFEEWNNTRHGTADGTPNELWAQSKAQFGDVGRPVKMDQAFLISTSIPVDATLGDRKGVRVGYREYWNDELNAIRKPFCLEDARLDPGTPSTLYVKVKNQWFVTESRDKNAICTLTPEGRFLENHRVRQNAAVARGDGKASKERLARRMEELEVSNISVPQSEPAAPKDEPSAPALISSVDLDLYADIPFVS